MKNLRKICGAWLLVFALLVNLLPPTALAAGESEITLPNGDFENGTTGWTLTGYSETKAGGGGGDNTTTNLNLWLSNDADVAGAAMYTVALTAGTYYFTFDLTGDASNSGLKYMIATGSNQLAASASTYTTTGWGNWVTHTTDSFVLSEGAEVTLLLPVHSLLIGGAGLTTSSSTAPAPLSAVSSPILVPTPPHPTRLKLISMFPMWRARMATSSAGRMCPTC